MKYNRILFMGSPDFAVVCLEKLVSDYKNKIVGIFSQPDKKKGRHKKILPTPVKRFALEQEIACFTPFNKQELVEKIKSLCPDLIVVVAYGMILPEEITNNYVCLNVHASILPKYRGASPITASILNRDTETGVTIIRMNEKMDEGNIVAVDYLKIMPNDNFGVLYDKLACLGADLLLSVLEKNLELIGVPQDESMASYCKKIQKKDLILDIHLPIEEFLAKVKAYSPFPGAYLEQNGKKYKIIEAENFNGKIKILKIKPEGKKIMNYNDFLLGHKKGLDGVC